MRGKVTTRSTRHPSPSTAPNHLEITTKGGWNGRKKRRGNARNATFTPRGNTRTKTRGRQNMLPSPSVNMTSRLSLSRARWTLFLSLSHSHRFWVLWLARATFQCDVGHVCTCAFVRLRQMRCHLFVYPSGTNFNLPAVLFVYMHSG